MKNLNKKVIVVTGGSGLIGKSIINDLFSFGALVINADVLVDNDLQNGTWRCDVTSKTSVEFCIKAILDRYNRIDGWVNNAYPRTLDWGNKFEDVLLDSWKQNVDLQLASVFICNQEILKIMKIQGFGSVVNIASIYGVVGPDFSVYEGTLMTMPAAYSAIKGGIINFTRYLSAYFGPSGVRVNCVSPGGILDNQNQLFIKQYENKVPLRRMGSPNDISPVVCFLLSDSSNYITGQNLIVDGGWTAI